MAASSYGVVTGDWEWEAKVRAESRDYNERMAQPVSPETQAAYDEYTARAEAFNRLAMRRPVPTDKLDQIFYWRMNVLEGASTFGSELNARLGATIDVPAGEADVADALKRREEAWTRAGRGWDAMWGIGEAPLTLEERQRKLREMRDQLRQTVSATPAVSPKPGPAPTPTAAPTPTPTPSPTPTPTATP